ncbi:HAD-IA family hydrolase [Corynebacterium sp.]|uniref:HAD-IA family hydrolase n=1 Tax=Corynebacterium sp. TaxID=1720 RepID=UPI003735604B
MRGLIVDYTGVLDGPEEDQARWRSIFAAVKATGVSTAVLSGEEGGEAAREWEYRGIVDAVIMSQDVGAERTEVAAFEEVAEAMDLPVNECVLIDDNINNIRTGVDAGMVAMLHTVFDRTSVEIASVFDLEGEF